MKRVITGTFLAATFAVGLSAQAPAPAPAQTPYPPQAQPTMQPPKDAAKSVTVTGCLKAGDSADTFILSNLKWADKATGAVGTAGSETVPAAVASATTLKLTPSASTKLTGHIGHTIEVTGIISDTDKTDRGALTTPPTPPTDPASPRPSASPASPRPSAPSGPSLEVRSLKMVSATCTPL